MSEARIQVALGARSYAVSIAPGLIGRIGDALAPYARGGRVLLVSDEQVWAALGGALEAGLAAAGLSAQPFLVPAGEASKSWEMLGVLIDRLLAHGIERGDHLVAFGGGVVGDLAGFAAAIVKRGCGFVQIPTTLLAQVDSSVGGKTGINVEAGKNLVGAFHQPAAVFIDPEVLATLPVRELRAGYAEVVKYGLIGDADLFAWCETNGAALIGGNVAARSHAIAASVGAKAAIVAEDERETGDRRALLNLGHTFGHALEAETGFGEKLLHGEAVAVGMALAFRFSAQRGLCPAADASRVAAHLRAAGLPASLADAGIAAGGPALVAHMMHDKKARGGRIPFILARGIGQAFVDWTVAPEEVAAFLDAPAAAAA